ncbi:hypothetical protein MP228_000814 [Amoeboaphelidium protococcarum]|nr:hypothetical protein MP228_000814 [Amoeboaphelidium protococcarum]
MAPKQDVSLDITSDDDFDSELQFKNYNLSPNSSNMNKNSGNAGFIPEVQPVVDNSGSAANKPFYSLDYYTQFFDVDTVQVFRRMLSAVAPKENFFDLVSVNCDLYGPFWIATTIAFLVFITDSIGLFLSPQNTDGLFHYKFSKLGTVAIILYCYISVISLGLYFFIRSLGYQTKFVEMIAFFGYSLTIWMPLTIVSLLPSNSIAWMLSIIGTVISGAFLVRNSYPLFTVPPQTAAGQSGDQPMNWGSRGKALSSGTLFTVIVCGCNVGLGLVFQLYFFQRSLQ